MRPARVIPAARSRRTAGRGALLVTAALLAGACSATETDRPDAAAPSTPSAPSASSTPTAPSEATPTPPRAGRGDRPGGGASPGRAEPSYPNAGPVSLPAYFDDRIAGGDLRLGAVREQTADYTSRDVTYRVTHRGRDLTISGVLNVPTGRGPFPAVVLGHGYIDPAVYVRGQGMTRERGYLAANGYIALHVDYRNHAESSDVDLAREVRLGYAVDMIAAVKALRASREVPLDDDRVAFMGRSMGGGVTYDALEMAPGLVDAGVVMAAVSSNQADNLRQFGGDGGSDFWSTVEQQRGAPAEDPAFWRGVSARSYLERITEPVLMHHGRTDTTCPPAWAGATRDAMRAAGVDVELQWWGEGHEFYDDFVPAMAETVAFLDRELR